MPFMKIFNAKGIEPVVNEINDEEPPRIVEEVLPHGRKKTLEVTIEDVRYQVGRAGTVSIILNFKPVNIGKIRLSYIGLRGRDDIRTRNIYTGDRAVISIRPYHTFRLIDIIPGDDRANNVQIKEPEDCPSCGSHLEKSDNFLICHNREFCKGQIFEKLRFFTGFKGLQLDTMRLDLLDGLVQSGSLCHYNDLFKLNEDKLSSVFPDMSLAERLSILNDIDKSKDKPLSQFIMALGIHKVYRGNAVLLADYFQNFGQFIMATRGQLEEALDDNATDGVVSSIQDYLKTYSIELKDLYQSGWSGLDNTMDDSFSSDIETLFSGKPLSLEGRSISLQDIKRHLEQTGIEITD